EDGLRLGCRVGIEVGRDLVARVQERPARVGVDRRAVRELLLPPLVLVAAPDERVPRELLRAGLLDARAGRRRIPRLSPDPVADPRADLDAGRREEEDDPRACERAAEA